MRNFLKKILFALPRPLRTLVVIIREWYWRAIMPNWEKQQYPNLPEIVPREPEVKNVLVYHISGLAFAGTEK